MVSYFYLVLQHCRSFVHFYFESVLMVSWKRKQVAIPKEFQKICFYNEIDRWKKKYHGKDYTKLSRTFNRIEKKNTIVCFHAFAIILSYSNYFLSLRFSFDRTCVVFTVTRCLRSIVKLEEFVNFKNLSSCFASFFTKRVKCVLFWLNARLPQTRIHF